VQNAALRGVFWLRKQHSSANPASKNKLFYGDNLDVPRNKIADNSVDLCYIDPPFNSNRDYSPIYNNQGSEARALANRKDDKNRKEIEKWAVLTYSANQARINHKKGADGGIDGVAYFLLDKDKNGKAVFQVKSGGANRATLATLNSDRQREGAEFGILITMDEPTRAMKDEITAAGRFKHPLLDREDDRLKVVTVEQLLAGARMDLPMARKDTVKAAKAEEANQPELF
jgi:hypothetical protein